MRRKSASCGFVRPESRKLAFLENTQEFWLQLERHFADLVEEQRTPRRLSDEANLVGRRSRERAFRVSEQLRLDEVLRERRTVDLHHRLLRTQAPEVNRVGDELLSGAGFAGDEDVRVRLCNALDQLEDVLHLLAASDDVAIRRSGRERVTQSPDLSGLVLTLDGLRDEDQQFLELDRLFDEEKGPGLRGFDGLRNRAVPRDHDDLGFGRCRPQAPNDFDTVDVREVQVREHDIEVAFARKRDSGFASRCRGDIEPFRRQMKPRKVEHRIVVVNDQHGTFLHQIRYSDVVRIGPLLNLGNAGPPRQRGNNRGKLDRLNGLRYVHLKSGRKRLHAIDGTAVCRQGNRRYLSAVFRR